jgi:hypothetical protein
MTDQPQEKMDRTQEDREAENDHMLERQEHKGYGEDEGERDAALGEPEDAPPPE